MDNTFTPLTREDKQWNKQLSTHIDRYSTLRDWSQLASWLGRVKQHLADFRGVIADKSQLLKKLATSLNPVLPVALHDSTLEIYDLLFVRFLTLSDIENTCLGLFTFYPAANVKSKAKIIEMLRRFLPPFGEQLRVLMSGLVISVLPSTAEMNETLSRQATSFCDVLLHNEEISKPFVESVWLAILRSPSCRSPGIRYLSNKLGKGVVEDEQDKEDHFWDDESVGEATTTEKESGERSPTSDPTELVKSLSPHIQTLGLSALLSCLNDSNNLVIKSALDFLYKYIPLRSELLTDKMKYHLTVALLLLLSKRDISVTRKVNLWLFGKPDSDNKYTISQLALENLRVPLTALFTHPNHDPIKIVLSLYTEHTNLMERTLHSLSVELVRFCMKNQDNQQTFKVMSRLIERIQSSTSGIIASFGSHLLTAVQQDSSEAQELLTMLLYLQSKLLRDDQSKKSIPQTLRLIVQSYSQAEWRNRVYSKLAMEKTIEILEKQEDNLKAEVQDQYMEINLKLYKSLIDSVNEKMDYSAEFGLMCRIFQILYESYDLYCFEWVEATVRNVALSRPEHYLPAVGIVSHSLDKEGPLKNEVITRARLTNNFVEECIYKLWNILSVSQLQLKIIPYLLRLIRQFPSFFCSLIETEFQSKLEASIIKFCVVWKHGPNYANLVLCEHLSQVLKAGMFEMLRLLEHENPLVRYNSRLWLVNTSHDLHRVVNPLLEILIKPNNFWYKTFQDQYFFAVSPPTDSFCSALNHITSIVKYSQDKFFKFSQKNLTGAIRPYYAAFLDDQREESLQSYNYTSACCDIAVRLLASNIALSDDNKLNLAACELTEALFRAAPTPQLCGRIYERVLEPILKSLHFSIKNSDYVMEIQQLNLLRVILFESQLKDCINLKASHATKILKVGLEGLGSSFVYIKERFVQFLNQCIPLLLDDNARQSSIVSHILNTYLRKIIMVSAQGPLPSRQMQLQLSDRNLEMSILFGGVKELLAYFLNLQVRRFEKQKTQSNAEQGMFNLLSWKSCSTLKLENKNVHEIGKVKKATEEIVRQILQEMPQILIAMTSSWGAYELRGHYKISMQGIDVFDSASFQSFNKELSTFMQKYESEDSPESFIVNFTRVLINRYPRDTLEAFLKSWETARSIDIKIKTIEILNATALPIEHFYLHLYDFVQRSRQLKKRKAGNFQVELIGWEKQLLNFCQAYTHYSGQNFSVFQPQSLLNLWMTFLKFLKLFQNSFSIQTLYAVLELLDLFLAKYYPRQILNNDRFKRQTAFLQVLLNDLVAVCSGKLRIEVKIKVQHIDWTALLPMPTSVFGKYLQQMSRTEDSKAPYLVFKSVSAGQVSETLRYHGFIILRRLGFTLVNLFHNESELAIIKRLREILTALLPLVQNKLHQSSLIEMASEVVLAVLEKKAVVAQQFRYEILQIFNRDDFFICSSKTLHCWVSIVEILIDNNKDQDLFMEYLEKVSLVSSIFSSYTAETKKRIKSFERICFILFAGKRDKYNDKVHLLIEKIIEVIKNADAPQPVLMLIFFCIRILILRTSPQRLTKIFNNAWQLILFLLTNIFRDKIPSSAAESGNLNLIWSALKLIEMISLVEMPQFHQHQWMFFYDFVGVDLEQNDSRQRPSHRPLIDKFLPDNVSLIKRETGEIPLERHLLIKEDKIDDVELLRTKSLLLSREMIANNEGRARANLKEVEEFIENDFLKLDDFIFKVK